MFKKGRAGRCLDKEQVTGDFDYDAASLLRHLHDPFMWARLDAWSRIFVENLTEKVEDERILSCGQMDKLEEVCRRSYLPTASFKAKERPDAVERRAE